MADPALKRACYEDLQVIPENMIGEILDGELILTPRPSRQHGYAATALGAKVTTGYQFGEGGGPGGWVIIIEPEIRFGEDFIVPDLAGWKRDRFPALEDHNWISIIPDWVCEILSPRTARLDKHSKMRVYSDHGVPHLWLIDPLNRTFDVFRLKSGHWVVVGLFTGDDRVRVEPFPGIEIDLQSLWLV